MKILIPHDTNFGPNFWQSFSEYLIHKGHQVDYMVFKSNDVKYYENLSLNSKVTKVLYDKNLNKFQHDDKRFQTDLNFVSKHINEYYSNLIVGDRHLGFAYQILGKGHPSSKLSKLSNQKLNITIIADFYRKIEKILKEEKYDLVLTNVIASFRNHLLVYISHKMDIKNRFLSQSKIEDYFYWADNLYKESMNITKSYFLKKNQKTLLHNENYHRYNYLNNKAIEQARSKSYPVNLSKLFLKFFKEIKRQISFFKLDLQFPQINFERYYFVDRIKYHYRYYKHSKYINKLTKNLQLDNRFDYIYFPLHLEPESTTMIQSPEFANQRHLIHWISRVIPANLKLIVKEHKIAIGKREKNFYKEILDYPNVILVNPNESSLDLINISEIIITISGTIGLEASSIGKPVISFGKHNLYNVLESIIYVSDHTKLKDSILNLIDKYKSNKLEIINDSFMLYNAIIENSFRFQGPYKNNFLLEDIDKKSLYDSLMRSLL